MMIATPLNCTWQVQMRIEQQIVAAWAKQLSDEIIKATIASLGEIDVTLSGEDSGLTNTWEEICAQVQDEESCDWDAYVEVMDDFLGSAVAELGSSARSALWAVTDDGWDYIYEHHAEEDGSATVPVFDQDIVAMLREELLSAAANYSNSNIRRYLLQLEGDDDEEEDYDDEDSEGDSDDSAIIDRQPDDYSPATLK